MELFEQHQPSRRTESAQPDTPLAERVRPVSLEEFAGQQQLLGEGKPLSRLIRADDIPSMIFWGPPGCGKTTLARLIARYARGDFFQLNAVSSGVADVRKVIERADTNRKKLGKRTILFIDEIHRFNKAQQDALLHSVESGIIILIGATTENPSFEVIPPLLSRCRVYVLEPLDAHDLGRILDHAIGSDPLLKKRTVSIGEKERALLMHLSGGDARSMLTGLETALHLVEPSPDGGLILTPEAVEQAFQRKHNRYDSDGEEHYNIISAFIKSMRGCDPDAAIYWMARMLDGGEDPKFIARRMLILASEDIGNADPSALPLATSCFTAVDYVGMPEARIILAQTAAYLASAPKSNAAICAIDEALHDVRSLPADPVPLHLRNAPTKLMKDLQYGKEYLYGHGFEKNFVPQQYLPEGLRDKTYYRPTDNGEEQNIKTRLNQWWKEKPR